MINDKKITAIILIAGNSTRYGTGNNKNFENLDGKMVFQYSLEQFDKNKYIDDIIIATREKDLEYLKKVVNKKNLNKPIKFVIGGNSRKQSVYNCIKTTDSSIVIIHDGARPAIKQEYINICIEEMKLYKGATIGVQSKDTIKITDDNNVVVNSTKRNNTWVVQTPQCFNREVLLNAHEKYINSDVTDDCMLLEKDGYKIKLIKGDYTNLKITTIEDLDIIKSFIEKIV